MALNQEQIDTIVKAMTLAGLDKHMELAKMAVEETGRGVYEDKITKNMFATEYVYHSIKNEKTVGVIAENDLEDYRNYSRACRRCMWCYTCYKPYIDNNV